MLDVDEDCGQDLALLGFYGAVEVLGAVGVGEGFEKWRKRQFLEGELLLCEEGYYGFLELGVVFDEVFYLVDGLRGDNLNGAFHLPLNPHKILPNRQFLLTQLITLILNGLELLLQRLIRRLTLQVPLYFLLCVIYQPRISERSFIGLEVTLHGLERPRVLFAHLEHYLLEGLVVADVLLEV